jgi:hypothetical protein
VLDNFFSNSNGLFPRKDEGYMASVHLDRDGDRVPDGVLRLVTYDLRFVHGGHAGLIWLRTFPYSYHLHEKPLDQLAKDYVAYMAADGTESAVIDDRAPGVPRVSVTVEGQVSWMVAGHPAEVLEILESPATGGVPRRARVVLTRPGFMYQHTNQRRENVLYPVLMVAGYSNNQEQFEVGLADFEGLLNQITVQGIAGLTKREEPGGTSQANVAEEPPPAPPPTDEADAPDSTDPTPEVEPDAEEPSEEDDSAGSTLPAESDETE